MWAKKNWGVPPRSCHVINTEASDLTHNILLVLFIWVVADSTDFKALVSVKTPLCAVQRNGFGSLSLVIDGGPALQMFFGSHTLSGVLQAFLMHIHFNVMFY